MTRVQSSLMKFLAAAALLVAAIVGAYGHHTPEHQLDYPKFVEKKTHYYDVWIKVTAGVPGMSAQVSKAVQNMELKIFAKTPSELILYLQKVQSSGAITATSGSAEAEDMKPDKKLEEHLKVPIKAILSEGKVKSYTLDPNESLESAKIKRTILRNLEFYLDKEVLRSRMQSWWPLTYNVSRSTPVGDYYSHYIVTASPWSPFPAEQNVYNITRSDNYETIPYLAYRTHHNFEQQGCPEVCRKDQLENRFGAGCPGQFEPYQTPMKKSFVQHHNLRKLKTGETIIDMVKTKETHVADVYDQNMEVIIRSLIKFKRTTSEHISESNNQQTYTDLNDMKKEINDKAVGEKCGYPEPNKAIEMAKNLLKKISQVVLEGNVEGEGAKRVGEQLILLQRALNILKKADLSTIHGTIARYNNLHDASEFEKIKRQIWYDNLPIIGSSESISFIVQLIKNNVNSNEKDLSLWEAKSILEAMPNNIKHPTANHILELSQLLDVLKTRETPGYGVFYSAAHLTVARVIRSLCSTSESEDSNNRLTELWMENSGRKCPKAIVKKFIQDVSEKLKKTEDRVKRVIYIETLARTGMKHALPVLSQYVNGHVAGLTPRANNFVRSATIYSLHNLVSKHPKPVRDIVLPVFHNKTEPPRMRTAAFGVFIRTTPTLGDLQHIAESSWLETSVDVASYITRAMESFGNSSIPCHQLTARRIKKVLPQMKRAVHGQMHAKSVIHTLFDSVRGFGLEYRDEVVPSNESFVPSVFYGALGYNADSLRDIFFQYALNIQGLTTHNTWDPILRMLGLKTSENIPSDTEKDIFEDMDIIARDTEFWKLTTFEKLFYSTSYYYFDAEETRRGGILEILKDQLSHYFTVNSQGVTYGHMVKVYIPSSYKTRAIGHVLPTQIEFEMRNPLLISLKLNSHPTPSTNAFGWSIDVQPTVYYSTLYTNQVLNLGDCKNVGVYHEKRAAATYPMHLNLEVEKNGGKVHVAYSFPQLPKKIFTYRSEAGTYAGRKTLEYLPAIQNRKTIHTLPAQFVKKGSFGFVGLPQFSVEVKTEDIQFGYQEMPRTGAETVQHIVKDLLNAGWRRKSIDMYRIPDSAIWTKDTEVKVHFDVSRDYVTSGKAGTESDWSKGLNFDEELKHTDTNSYAKEGQTVYETLTSSLDHLKDEVSVRVEHEMKGKTVNSANFNIVYRHTLGGFLHFVHVNASGKAPKIPIPLSMSADYVVGFISRPNEFHYEDQNFGKQKGLALGAVSFSKDRKPFREPYVIVKALFNHESLSKVLAGEMNPQPTPEHFLPETHQQCMNDVHEGKPQSVDCIKAIHEAAIYNKIRVQAIWKEDLPFPIYNAAHQLDLALKHAYFTHMSSHKKTQHNVGNTVRHLYLEGTYINKMTDKPVIDFMLEKPQERLIFRRVNAGWMTPMSSIEGLVDTYVRRYSNNTYPATCTLMEKYVRTYDLKTYPLPKDISSTCTYLLSSHCMLRKKFAIFAKINSQKHSPEEIYMHMGKNKLVLTPSGNSRTGEYKIHYNGQEHSVKLLLPVLLDEEMLIYAFTNVANDGSTFIEVHATKAGVKVTYDGKNVKVQVHPRYKGELCGLCSEFNGEVEHEFRGPNRCLYSHSSDFVKSNIRGQCSIDKTPTHPYICNDGQVTHTNDDAREENTDDSEPSLKRNMVVSHEDSLCFSVRPLPMCGEGRQASETRQEEVDFHCLPKEDFNARKLVTESKRRILGEMETKSADHARSVEVAKRC